MELKDNVIVAGTFLGADIEDMSRNRRQGYIRESCRALRTAGMPEFIKGLAWRLGLECQVEVDKGWIKESVRWEVSGNEETLVRFKDAFELAIKEYLAV